MASGTGKVEMHSFNFRSAKSVGEASEQMSVATDGIYLAGGMSLIPILKLRLAAPDSVIDLGDIAELRGIRESDREITFGAMTTHSEIAESHFIPALAELASSIGDPQVRNRGTIGGSLANSDPAADYPAAVLALGAVIQTSRREIPSDAYFRGLFETALEEGEIITAVRFPIPRNAAYAKFPNPASRYAVVGVFVAETTDGIRVGITGAGPCAFRGCDIETALTREVLPSAIDSVEVDSSGFNDDLHASAQYRAQLVKVMAKRATAQLLA